MASGLAAIATACRMSGMEPPRGAFAQRSRAPLLPQFPGFQADNGQGLLPSPKGRPMSRSHRVLWAFAALLAMTSLGSAQAASLNGTVTLSPGDQPSSGVWVSAVRLGDYLKYTADDASSRPHGSARVAVTDAHGAFSFR